MIDTHGMPRISAPPFDYEHQSLLYVPDHASDGAAPVVMGHSGSDGTWGRTDPGLITPNNPVGLDNSDPAAADDIVSINQIMVPVDRPLRFTLRSRDVIHSFFLSYHRVKQDAVPGMSIDIWFVSTREGRFEIPCAELCGLGHYRMQAYLNVLPANEYEQWLRDQQPAPAN